MTMLRVDCPKSTAAVRNRTCIATRKRLPESQLLRMVARGSEDGSVAIIPDPKRHLPGRGAWITPTVQSWEQAVKRRAFGRALRVSATADAQPVLAFIQGWHDDKRKT